MRSMTFILLLLAWAETSCGQQVCQNRRRRDVRSEHRGLIRSKRRWVLTTIDIEEENPGPFPIKLTELFNDNQDHHGELRFHISGHGVTEDPIGALDVNEKTGEVYMCKPIDREKHPIIHVNFDVINAQTGEELDKTLSFDVAIQDKNDNTPEFKPQVLNVKIPENIQGTLPFSLQANDIDEPGNDNSFISMRKLSQIPPLPKISIKTMGSINDSTVGKLLLDGCFDYEKVKSYRLLVEAKDNGIPSHSSTGTVNIFITDYNTHPPKFTAAEYNTTVMEMQANKELLRIPVEDKDTPNTPASRAVFTILKGNQDNNYEIKTDPSTNEGVLSVIKAKDYEHTTLAKLEIGVENEEPLFLCINGKPVSPIPESHKKGSTVTVNIKVIDVNDAPLFKPKSNKIYKMENEEPGTMMYQPVITDPDNHSFRCKIEDPANWLSIDPETCKVTTARKMDRESPHVINDLYTAVIHATDNGEPPATGTGTLIIQLGDRNDNFPYLISNTSIICGNKANHVKVRAEDADLFPFSAPFTFTLDTEDKKLKNLWKIDPTTGQETSLISLTTLPYGVYVVPLKIADQQGMETNTKIEVTVCNCGNGDVCHAFLPRSSSLHGAAIGILLGAMLLMTLLFCLCFICKCKKKRDFKEHFQSDGDQTLISYNEEGGQTKCMSDIQFLHDPTGSFGAVKTARPTQGFNEFREMTVSKNMYGGAPMPNAYRDSVTSKSTYGRTTSISRDRMNNTYNTMMSRMNRSFNFNIEDLIEKKLTQISMDHQHFQEYNPHDFSSEGTMENAVSLDKLSFCGPADDQNLLQNLGPQFSTLGEICQQALKEKNIKL